MYQMIGSYHSSSTRASAQVYLSDDGSMYFTCWPDYCASAQWFPRELHGEKNVRSISEWERWLEANDYSPTPSVWFCVRNALWWARHIRGEKKPRVETRQWANGSTEPGFHPANWIKKEFMKEVLAPPEEGKRPLFLGWELR